MSHYRGEPIEVPSTHHMGPLHYPGEHGAGHGVTFIEKENELQSHDIPRSFKLKRADEHFANPEDCASSPPNAEVSPFDVPSLGPETIVEDLERGPSTTSSSPHVVFDAPEDILHPHERSRSAQLKLADEIYVPSDSPGSPHVVFVEAERVLREHELSRLPMYKKGDERMRTRSPTYTVEVAPYRVLFNTPEDLLLSHESPRAPCLKLADEAYVRQLDMGESATTELPPNVHRTCWQVSDSEGSEREEESSTKTPRFSLDQKTPIIQMWHTNLIAGGLRTLSTACPTTEAEREQRVKCTEELFNRLKGKESSCHGGHISLDQLITVLHTHSDLRALRQASHCLLSDVKVALQNAGREDVLKLEDFTALLLTLCALFEQNEFLIFMRDVECKMSLAPFMSTDQKMVEGCSRKRPASPSISARCHPQTSIPRHDLGSAPYP
jgi:hypothetical protein